MYQAQNQPIFILLYSEIVLLPTSLSFIEQENLFFFTLIAHKDIFWSHLISPQFLYLIISCIALKRNDMRLASNFGWNSTLHRKPAYDSLHSLGQKLGAWLALCTGMNSIYSGCQCADYAEGSQSYWRKGKGCILSVLQSLVKFQLIFPFVCKHWQTSRWEFWVFSYTTVNPCVCTHVVFVEISFVSFILSAQVLLSLVGL